MLSISHVIRLFYLAVFFLALIFTGCQKDPSELGLNLHPQDDRISGSETDTVTLEAYTINEDSISSDERSLALLGSCSDPVFGRSDASFITQIRLSSTNVSFGTTPTADSIVLYLDYQGYYGDTSALQTVKIYELQSDIYADSTYYSNMNPASLSPLSILDAPFVYSPKPNDTTLAIRLNDELAQRFVNTGAENLAGNDAFINWFKGIYIKTDSIFSGGAIIYYNLLSPNSKVTLYYHNDGDTTDKKFDFVINSSCARINLFKHDYSQSQITSLNDSLSNDSLLYLQGMSGTNARIKFPFVSNLKDSSAIAIVKAELIIPVNVYDNTTEVFPRPSRLLLVSLNSDGNYGFVPDYFLGDYYFGGSFHEGTQTYRFNISRYIQQLVDKSVTDYGLVLLVSENRVSARRVVIRGPGSGLKLSITYLKP